jgi:hypothetical protein
MTCPILNLPNEILNETFKYIRTPITVQRCVGEGHFSEIFGIRSVCRRFRAVSNEMSFWYDEDFDLLDLIPDRPWFDPADVHRDCQAFLKVLFSDKHLVQSLARRSIWRFENLISFQSVMELVPSFYRNTTVVVLSSDFICDEPASPSTIIRNSSVVKSSMDSLSLQGITFLQGLEFRHLSPPPPRKQSPTPIQIVFSNLVSCHSLTSLHLSEFREPFDLDLVVRFCPLLRKLSLNVINQYRGTLRTLSCLEDFDVREFPSHVGVASEYIYPTSSAMSLTRLSIIHEEWDSDDDEPTPRWPAFLDTFVNLTSLCLSPFTNTICDFIVRSHLRLIDFRLQLTYHPEIAMSKVADMFSAPSLRHLRHLRFSVDVYPEEPHFPLLIRAIISNLSSLEELCLAMPLDLSWCEQFGHLVNLKRLLCYIPEIDCRDSDVLLFRTDDLERPTKKEYDKKEYEKGGKLVARAFAAAFQHFMVKPIVKTVVTCEEAVFREWLTLMTTDSHVLFQ